jgi:hypothetical protein
LIAKLERWSLTSPCPTPTSTACCAPDSTLIRAQLAEDKAPLSWRVALLRLAARFADDYRVAQACAQLYLTLNSDPTTLPTFSALRRPTETTTKPAAQPDPADQPPSA